MPIAVFGPVFECGATTIWFWITCLIGLVWLKRHIDFNRGRNEPMLWHDEPGVDTAHLPSLSVLVAAKDEEHNIRRCIEGLIAQNYPNLQLIFINDRSTDRTGRIIEEYAARDRRVTAIHVADLPSGWFGKNHAMHVGTQHATGQWLCFSDADCVYASRHLLMSAVRFALRERVDFLSVLPRLEAETFWEHVVQPVAGAILVYWFPPHKVNSPRSPRAYANGAFMLLSSKTYQAVGGHARIRATLSEDMQLAHLTKAARFNLRVIRGGEMYHVHMYRGLRQIWKGWSRIFYGCFGTLPRLLISFFALSVFSLSPYAALLASPFVGGGWLAIAAAFAIAAQQSILLRFYRLTGHHCLWATSYPLGATVCLGITLNAMRHLVSTATYTWRGTTYRGGAPTSP